jgi:hypothetical protein
LPDQGRHGGFAANELDIFYFSDSLGPSLRGEDEFCSFQDLASWRAKKITRRAFSVDRSNICCLTFRRTTQTPILILPKV